MGGDNIIESRELCGKQTFTCRAKFRRHGLMPDSDKIIQKTDRTAPYLSL